MKKIAGWGIPFVGVLALSAGLWAVLFLGGTQLIEIFIGMESPWGVLMDKDKKSDY